jgi:feruloyl esterase
MRLPQLDRQPTIAPQIEARPLQFAWHNRQAEIDWGQRAVTETARVTKLLIRSLYGREQEKSYFAGCSTGGRMAQMEAWR